jgi:hypothetical protein
MWEVRFLDTQNSRERETKILSNIGSYVKQFGGPEGLHMQINWWSSRLP